MNHPTEITGICPTHIQLQDRCRVLGLPTWRFDADGALMSAPSDTGILAEWLRAAPIQSAIADTIASWKDRDCPLLDEIFHGLWIIPLVEHRRRRRAGYVIAVAVGPEIFTAPIFEDACRSVGMDPSAAAPGIARITGFTRPAVERIARCLHWSLTDIDALQQSESAVAGFSRQLAESYEEISLLYKLGQSMNQFINPQRFVALACDELQATLAYEWIALRFITDRKLARAMTGKLMHSGSIPTDPETFDHETARFLEGLEVGRPSVLPASERGALGRDQSQLLIHPVAREGKVVAALFAGCKMGDDPQVSSTDIKLLDAAAGYLSILLDNAILYDDQQLMFVGTLEALTATIDAKDPYTCGHSQRVSELAAALASAHGLDEEQVERIRIAGIVHDVGKIGVPEAVLCKTGRLTEEEFQLIKQHPEIGYQILKDIPQFDDVLPGVLYHHERYDGRGYPHKLSGENIPLMARIIGLVDAFDAMSSNRTYRAAMPRERVFEELEDNKRTQFDPDLVDSFKLVDLERYDALVEKHQTESAHGGLRIRRRGLAA